MSSPEFKPVQLWLHENEPDALDAWRRSSLQRLGCRHSNTRAVPLSAAHLKNRLIGPQKITALSWSSSSAPGTSFGRGPTTYPRDRTIPRGLIRRSLPASVRMVFGANSCMCPGGAAGCEPRPAARGSLFRLAGRGYREMRLQEVAHPVDRPGFQFGRVLPGID
jgi:hypothetical protein